MEQKVPLMIVPSDISKKIAAKTRGIGSRLLRFFPYVEHDLEMTDIDADAEAYMALSNINALLFAFVIGGLTALLFWTKDKPVDVSILLGLVIGLGIYIAFMILFARYPSILAFSDSEISNSSFCKASIISAQ